MQKLATTTKEADGLVDATMMSPRSVGDVISASVRVCRRSVPLLVRFLFWPALASAVTQVVALFGLIRMESAISRNGQDVTSWSTLLDGLGILGVGLLVAVPVHVILVLRQLAVLRVVTRFSETVKDADKYMWRNFWKLVVVALAYYGLITVWIILWSILIVLVTVVGAMFSPILLVVLLLSTLLLSCFSFLVLLVPLAVVAPAVACENRGLWSVIQDSTNLSFRHFWRTSGFCTLLFVTVWLMGSTLGLPGQILYLVEYIRSALHTGTFPTNSDIPFYAQALTTAWHSVVNIFLGPLVTIGAGLYYFDLRVREQGLDILRLVQSPEMTDNTTR